MRTLRDALRAALRGAAARPALTAVVVLTLAVGIGANTAIFTVADATLRRGLPYPEPERLYAVQETRAREGFEKIPASYSNFLDYRAQAKSFSGLAGFSRRDMLLRGRSGAELIEGARVSPELFTVLGARARLGQLLAPDDEKPEVAPVAVVSHAFWQNRLGADPMVVGKTLTLDDASVTGA